MYAHKPHCLKHIFQVEDNIQYMYINNFIHSNLVLLMNIFIHHLKNNKTKATVQRSYIPVSQTDIKNSAYLKAMAV